MNDFKQGMGIHSMWGLSPSFDLLSSQRRCGVGLGCSSYCCCCCCCYYNCESGNDQKQEEINILLANPGDVRHVLHTLGRRHRHNHPRYRIHIFLLEPEIEILARHILQLKIFLDEHVPIRHRACLYLELYNALISRRAYDYVEQSGKELGEFVYYEKRDSAGVSSSYPDDDDDDGQENKEENEEKEEELALLRQLVDLSWLKQKERDALYHVFHKEWLHSDDKQQEHHVKVLRDFRLRGYYRDRYDCRHNVSEWDYYARVKHTAGIIHVDQWRKWRMTGIAYEFGNTTYDQQNLTMITTTQGTIKSGQSRGTSKDVKGYWLDILNGPYVSHGVEVDSEHMYARGLLEVLNKGTGAEQYRHHTVEVAMFNLMDFMWEFETGARYEMKTQHDIFSGLVSIDNSHGKETKVLPPSHPQYPNSKQSTTESRQGKAALHDDGITIIPLLGDLDNLLIKKKKYHGRFDYVFLSQRVAQWFGSDKFKSILRIQSPPPPENEVQDPHDRRPSPSPSSDCHPCSCTCTCPCSCHYNVQHRNINAQVEVESGKFIFQIKEKDQIALYERIKNMAEIQGFAEIPSSRKNLNTNNDINEAPWNKNTFLFQATP